MTRERQLGDISSKSSRGFGVPRRNVAGVTAVQSPRPWDANQNINYSSKVQRVLGNNCSESVGEQLITVLCRTHMKVTTKVMGRGLLFL